MFMLQDMSRAGKVRLAGKKPAFFTKEVLHTEMFPLLSHLQMQLGSNDFQKTHKMA